MEKSALYTKCIWSTISPCPPSIQNVKSLRIRKYSSLKMSAFYGIGLKTWILMIDEPFRSGRICSILCLTPRKTVTSARIRDKDACHRARNLCVVSRVQKRTPGLTHKGCVLQRVSLGARSDVTVVLWMRQSIDTECICSTISPCPSSLSRNLPYSILCHGHSRCETKYSSIGWRLTTWHSITVQEHYGDGLLSTEVLKITMLGFNINNFKIIYKYFFFSFCRNISLS